jgi:hypothetical protein
MGQIAAAAASFPADRGAILKMPPHHTFHYAENPYHLVLVATGLSEDILRYIVANVVYNSFGEEWEDCVLLQLVRHNRSVRFSRFSNRQSLLAIADGVVQNLFNGRNTHRTNAESTTEQPISDFEKPLALFWYVTLENPILVDVSQLVKHIDSWYLDISENQFPVINTV